MVRNVASMQAHDTDVPSDDSALASPPPPWLSESAMSPPTQQQRTSSPLKRLNRHLMQLRAHDDYTKALMNKVATGEATDAEQSEFNAYVNQASRQPSLAHLLNNDQQGASPPPRPTQRKPAPSRSSFDAIIMAQLGDDEETQAGPPPPRHSLHESRSPTLSPISPTANTHAGSSKANPAQIPLLDYQMQLMQLEQQNVKRLRLARQEQELIAAQKRIDGQNEAPQQPVQTTKVKPATRPDRFKQATRQNAAKYTQPFCDFLTENPTVFHCVAAMKKQLDDAGFTELSERESWEVEPSQSYYVVRNGSSLIAFTVGAKYEPGNGAAILAGHVDALTAKLKPISQVPNKAGYLQLGVAPYAGALNSTWWDRDLGIGGRVHVKEGDKIVTKLVKLDWPIARIPTLAPHFGEAANGPFNKETRMVPIIGLTGTETHAGMHDSAEPHSQPPLLGGSHGPVGSFAQTQPPALVAAITDALNIKKTDNATIVNWELELFDVQPATVGGLNKEFIFAGRIDDKLCSWAALQALLESEKTDTEHSSLIKIVGLFDDEEIGSLLRQGAKSNFLPMTIERAICAITGFTASPEIFGMTYANSFMVSSDVTHAVNANFLDSYLENHAPHLNVGVAIAADSNGHMTTDSVSTTILKRCAEKVGAQLQVFQIRNDSRSGGTVGPMLSSALGVRTIDAGLPQLSMHSIRATTGALDPGLGVLMFAGFLNGFEAVDKEFQG